MRKNWNNKFSILVFWFLLLGNIALAAKLPKVVARFGGECQGEIPTSQTLQRAIAKQQKKQGNVCQEEQCLESFAFDLNGDRQKEYFVRLGCGGTGNCTWGIYQTKNNQLIGKFTAWFFYIHRRQKTWSMISTYTREGADQGEITRLIYRGKNYHQIYLRTEEGDYKNPQPFLRKMGVPKCS